MIPTFHMATPYVVEINYDYEVKQYNRDLLQSAVIAYLVHYYYKEARAELSHAHPHMPSPEYDYYLHGAELCIAAGFEP